ncbi:L-serine ammonia-lyase [Microbacterium sp.]|uniref:L-serine ammonia-lyase n=1 Tax=Microbacterium sp. TaxID=51671 RepID=UPI000927729B|nr:L-serine ammonia-lyase [Microbacterium sp.]MBN9187813.1 L-serine ammonia-lyase [Microbacterium sp.]MBN9193925.1 L-serine ammonia-lyase [Microbacterium sp.]OJU70140.1 MAG: L-serine ammonia-lyase [Microbacterium sp. 70-38]
MSISVFDLFKIGIGPSSSHTVGPMRAGVTYVDRLRAAGLLDRVARVQTHLFGSLALTGQGHGTIKAVVLGLQGEHPHLVEPIEAERRFEESQKRGLLELGGTGTVAFDVRRDVILHLRERLHFHSNGMRFDAFDEEGGLLDSREYYSVGGGFIADQEEIAAAESPQDQAPVPFPFDSADELVATAVRTGKRISDIVLANELAQRSEVAVRGGILRIWSVMAECIENGTRRTGVLPGGLNVRRRAAIQREQLEAAGRTDDPLHAMEWVTLAALAVNEENAAGGRVVTAPTNGAAGIIPAVLDYYRRFVRGADDDGVVRFLLTASAIGMLFKKNASISGAEVGCQGEVGSACSMAAAGLAEVLGGTPQQIENAAEIGIEHNLGLTCDPVGGLVQIPCIERNAIASVKAITAARMAVRSDGEHHVSLDAAIRTMRDTGADMSAKYKETAEGGLALNVAMVDC